MHFPLNDYLQHFFFNCRYFTLHDCLSIFSFPFLFCIQECEMQCQNGGTVNKQSCTCSCPVPWTGPDCSGTVLQTYNKSYFYISSDSFVLFGGDILHNPRINCLKSWVRLWLFEGKSGANEQLIKMRGDYVLICKGNKWFIPLAY